MWKFIAVVSAIWIGFIVWARIDSKRRMVQSNKKNNKPAFRTEDDLNEYGKPMKDEHTSEVDFDDAE